MPAFSLIKVFSSFFFARHNTKLPFYISLISVLLNIIISVIFFKKIGFIIIPIATTISSWFNSILLFIFLKKENLFKFNLIFFSRFIRMIFSVIIMGLFFNYLIIYFASNLAFEQSYKSAYLVAIVLVGLISYLISITLILTGINIIKNKEFFLILENLFFVVLYSLLGTLYNLILLYKDFISFLSIES